MYPRRLVEKFEDGKWTRESGQDGKTFVVSVKVNGAAEKFKIALPASDSVNVTAAAALGRAPTEADWEAAAKVKIMEAVASGFLDVWPASVTLFLPGIDWREVDSLFAEAKRKGWI
jgi:hypothetical protein